MGIDFRKKRKNFEKNHKVLAKAYEKNNGLR
jgi:hypothetical protein